MTYNEIESKSLGKLKILAHIDNKALLERMSNVPDKYIIATNFNIEEKSWDFGSYYYSFQDVIEEFMERVLNGRNIKTSQQKATEELYDLSTRISEIAHKTDKVALNEFLENEKEMNKLKIEFKQNTINDKKLQEHFKEHNEVDRFSNIMYAGTILGGIELRNKQVENGYLKGEREEFPYTPEQVKMIDRYCELERKQEELGNQIEENMEEDMEM